MGHCHLPASKQKLLRGIFHLCEEGRTGIMRMSGGFYHGGGFELRNSNVKTLITKDSIDSTRN